MLPTADSHLLEISLTLTTYQQWVAGMKEMFAVIELPCLKERDHSALLSF